MEFIPAGLLGISLTANIFFYYYFVFKKPKRRLDTSAQELLESLMRRQHTVLRIEVLNPDSLLLRR